MNLSRVCINTLGKNITLYKENNNRKITEMVGLWTGLACLVHFSAIRRVFNLFWVQYNRCMFHTRLFLVIDHIFSIARTFFLMSNRKRCGHVSRLVKKQMTSKPNSCYQAIYPVLGRWKAQAVLCFGIHLKKCNVKH